ncbi:MAG: Phosphoribosyl-AMP cyclohydrolase [Promethearchaeota archaeon]|jgi:phosphoribosyl-AMP cyclohydrolase|nr:MAG: Phosphoribosyl-AMP cyclohydrolase [Candidatus Lokiarchaeota archaeon]
MKKYSDRDIDNFIDILDFSKIEGGLVPVVAQDYETNEILMLAFSNEEAVRKTLETGYAHYYSRSRDTLWKKGGTSGHVQEVKKIIIDCDNDSILLKVHQIGAPCHKGFSTCFYNEYSEEGSMKLIGKKVFDPEEVYKNPE